jgi:alkylhydroperoxidase/carboxymuconolactone decarboxylase family protein YurZ
MLACHNTIETGMGILLEETAQRGIAIRSSLSAAERRIKDQYVARVGRWPEGGDALFQLAPDFVHAFLAYAEIPYESTHLPRKIKAFVGIAIHASPVAPQPVPLRHHISAALDAGAKPEEITDVLQLSSAIAIHSCTFGVPALVEAVAERSAC